MRRHARASSVRLLGLSLFVGLLLFPASASALKTHLLSTSFGSAGSGDGQLSLVAPNFNAEPAVAGSGLAVNQASHDVYVADTGNHRVVQFSSAGTFIRAFGADVGGPGIDVCSSGCVAGTAGSDPGAFEAPTLIAIDNSPGGDGDVYVGDTANDLVSKFEADGTLVSSWGAGGQLDGSTATAPFAGPFFEIVGVAVDPDGNLNVLENGEHVLFRFAQDGTFLTDFETPRGTVPGGLAVDPDGTFYKLNGIPTVERFTATATAYAQVGAFESAKGLAVDSANGELYADRGNSIENFAFNPAGEVIQANGTLCAPQEFEGCNPTGTFGSGDLTAGAGLAVDGTSHSVYAADPGAGQIRVFVSAVFAEATTEAASPVGTTSATLHGTVNADEGPEASCEFQYTTEVAFEEEGFQGATSAPCTPPGPFTGSGSEAVSTALSDLAPGTTYRFRVLATNEHHTTPGEALSFQTLGPAISGGSVSAVTETGATIKGSIDPRGEETSFAVEYVTEAQFLADEFEDASVMPVPAAVVGSGSGFVEVSQQLSGLTPSTAYRFRLVASNATATSHGADGRFTTFAPTAASLPDGRAYELVSPPSKLGEVIPLEPGYTFAGTCYDTCLPAGSALPVQAAPDGESVVYEGQPFSGGLAARSNQYLSRRGSSGWGAPQVLNASPFLEFSAEQGFREFSPDLTRSVLYNVRFPLSSQAPSREGKLFANLYLREEGGLPRPLVTEEPLQRLPGDPTEEPNANKFQVRYEVANSGTPSSPALSHVVFGANDALTDEVEDIAPVAPAVEADEKNLYEWSDGELRLVNVLPGNETALASAVIGSGHQLAVVDEREEGTNVDHAISADGSRIFWSDGSTGQIYVRIDGKETLKVDDPGEGKFLTAAADGSKVLLSDGCLYDLEEEECEEDLTEGEGGFQGILGAAEDLSRVYFVDTAALTPPGEENDNEEHAEAGKANLYAWDQSATAFIGALQDEDNITGGTKLYGDWRASRQNRTAQVSPDGRYLAFMSRAPLTGYDNAVQGGGQCKGSKDPDCKEVFQYDAGTGRLSCPSCNPTGEPPVGPSNLSLIVAEYRSSRLSPFKQPGNLVPNGQGRLFFESQDTLSPRDLNGHIQDVYEWTPEGVGGCDRTGGCVALISSGKSKNDSMFFDATPSGNDAFFITREQLLPRDKDDMLDLYDARVGGGFNEAIAPPCLGEACKGPVPGTAPAQSPGTSSFNGPPNKKQGCHKPKKCKKQKKKHRKQQKHKKQHKRSAKNNRGGSK